VSPCHRHDLLAWISHDDNFGAGTRKTPSSLTLQVSLKMEWVDARACKHWLNKENVDCTDWTITPSPHEG
jgi:hypothetical protein